eukprot:TRINITY_DN10586_c0_g2_i1.p1 TRINITY_DN10586_c0_g2~~TRINITY_DN10586_c0_g2_i1.p1  ORF type:complete len:379 (+),score=76.63 TRINITY_DN10586_c0_g2_i1:77-1138(+)
MTMDKKHSATSLLMVAVVFLLVAFLISESEAGSVPIARVWRELTEKRAAAAPTKLPIKLTSATLERYLLREYRNYSSVVYLTLTDPNCQACRLVEDKWNKAADAWHLSRPRDSYHVFFFTYATTSKDPLIVKLEAPHIPMLVHFGPSKDTNAKITQQEDVYQLTMQTLQETMMLNWVNERTGAKITPYVDPWPRIIFSFIIAIIFALVILGISHYVPKLFTSWRDPFVWYNIALVPFFMTIAGTVWNAIRQPTMFSQNPYTGKIMLIAPSAQYQFIFEGFFIAGLTVTIAALIIFITTTLETLPPAKQRLFFYPMATVLFLSLWLLLNLFCVKHKYYPFGFGQQINHWLGLAS